MSSGVVHVEDLGDSARVSSAGDIDLAAAAVIGRTPVEQWAGRVHLTVDNHRDAGSGQRLRRS